MHENAAKASGTGGAALFVYDLHGTAGGLPSSYPHLISEYDSTGAPIREYIWLGDTPVAMAMPDVNTSGVSKLFYIHTDHLSTPRIAIERSNGAQRWRWIAEPFGTSVPEERANGAPALTQPLRFSGQYADAESGMAYNGMRSYISGVGRYSQSDPEGLQIIRPVPGAPGFPIPNQAPGGIRDPDFPPGVGPNWSPSPAKRSPPRWWPSMPDEDAEFCRKERRRCAELCEEAECKPDFRNIWGGSIEKCIRGCLPEICGGNKKGRK